MEKKTNFQEVWENNEGKESKPTIVEVLSKMQRELKVPKGQFNSFGGYKYRSCEDIVEAVKQVMPEGYVLNLTDEIVLVGDRYYVKATARLQAEGENCLVSDAYAREPLAKKGMDESQITGAASSYARKYALNGLFGIDDTKDADTQDNTENDIPRARKPEKGPSIHPDTAPDL